MSRRARPWFRSKRGWFVVINGEQVNLNVSDPDDEPKAWAEFHSLLQRLKEVAPSVEPPKAAGKVLEMVPRFLDYAAKRVKPKTVKDYGYHLDWLLKHYAGDTVSTLDAEAIEDRVGAERWSDSHKANVLWTVQKFVRWAGVPGFALRRPAKQSRGGDAIVTEEVYKRVLRETTGDFHQLIRFLWLTGCRPMEGARLTCEAVDWKSGTVRLKHHKLMHKGKPRIIFPGPEALGVLKEQADRHGTGPLFRGQRGEQLSLQSIVTRFIRIRTRIGAPVTAYCFRHTFATRALSQGIPDTHVAALLGHSSTRMVHDHYSHIGQNASLLRDAAARIEAG